MVLYAGKQNGALAQLVEQWTFNPKVEGSIPSRPTIKRGINMDRNVNENCTRCNNQVNEEWRWRWLNMMSQCENWPYMCQNCVSEYLGESVVSCTIERTNAWRKMFHETRKSLLKTMIKQYINQKEKGNFIESFSNYHPDELKEALDELVKEAKI